MPLQPSYGRVRTTDVRLFGLLVERAQLEHDVGKGPPHWVRLCAFTPPEREEGVPSAGFTATPKPSLPRC